MVVKEVDRELVGCHHDCCVRNLANYNERKKISQEFLTTSLHICPSQYPLLSIHLLVYLPTYLLIYPFICPSFYLSGHLSIYVSVKELRRLVHKAGEAEFTDDEKETFHAALSTIIRCWSHRACLMGADTGLGARILLHAST